MKKLLLASLCFLMLCASQVFAQSRTVTGTVTAKDDGLPLPGVTVKVTGTSIGAQTGANGKYTLSVPATAKSLTFSFVGFTTEVVNIGSGPVNAVLSSDAKALNEVVVSAGGLSITRKAQGYATTQIKAEELTQGKAQNVGAALSGKVAGLQVNAVSSGVNPTVRLVLRGNRSLLGNNQALVVVDNNIVPNAVLGNLNPEDIDDIQVLNGSGAAALYGSDASNGAVIITTKKGKNGVAQVRASQTITGESVSFYPKLQKAFGSGSDNDVQLYIPYENQQYGPAFDGSMRTIGYPLADGRIQTVAYSPNDSRSDFWETGMQKQTDFSIQSGDDKATTFVSGQYFTNNSTTPGDKFNRMSIRANGTRKLPNHFSINYNTNYVQNRYDISSSTASIYDQLNQTPAQIVITDYKDYKNNPFADINGYYNGYYANPYFTAANERQKTRNDYLVGNLELKYAPATWLDFTYRVGITTQNASQKSWVGKYTTSAYTKTLPAGGVKTADGVGSVSDLSSFSTLLTNDLYATFHKQVKDFNVNFTVGGALRQNRSNNINVGATGLLVDGLYNVGARTTANITGGEADYLSRQQAIYGNLQIGYKGYLNLHVTGRNDWLSVLAPQNQSFFYPSADVSFVPTEAFDALKNNKYLTSLKLRAGVSKVGNASNVGPYGLIATASPGGGFPYATLPGYSLDGSIVSNNLKPEITNGWEAGFDAEFWDSRVTTSFTYYHTSTKDQTVPISISSATGFTNYVLNTGEMLNDGIETAVSVIPYKSASGWQVTLGANFVYQDNKVASLIGETKELSIGSNTFAIVGSSYPTLKGTDYTRDAQGRVIVNQYTGAPTNDGTLKVIGNTNAKQRLGLNMEVKYKSLRLAALAEYRGGFIIYNGAGTSYDFAGSGLRTVYYNRERFVFPNSVYLDAQGNSVPNNNVTVADGGANFWSQAINRSVATNYVTNGASWKLREASLSYDLPKSLLGRTKVIKGATVSLQGRNLFLWLPKSNIYTDPEYNVGGSDNNAIGVNSLSQTPPTRLYSATLSLTF